MKPKLVLKICVDIAMTVVLLLLMTYELIGKAAHEWIGVSMFVLLILHHILNSKWSKNILKGSYTVLRILQTALVISVLLCTTGSMVSGVVLSRHAFAFLTIRGGQSWARTLHLICSYWGFVMMSLHLGFHWNMNGNGKKTFWIIVREAYMDASVGCCSDCGLWRFRFCTAGNRQLYVSEK